eukprot:scpid42975/ scgid18315/ 
MSMINPLKVAQHRKVNELFCFVDNFWDAVLVNPAGLTGPPRCFAHKAFEEVTNVGVFRTTTRSWDTEIHKWGDPRYADPLPMTYKFTLPDREPYRIQRLPEMYSTMRQNMTYVCNLEVKHTDLNADKTRKSIRVTGYGYCETRRERTPFQQELIVTIRMHVNPQPYYSRVYHWTIEELHFVLDNAKMETDMPLSVVTFVRTDQPKPKKTSFLLDHAPASDEESYDSDGEVKPKKSKKPAPEVAHPLRRRKRRDPFPFRF